MSSGLRRDRQQQVGTRWPCLREVRPEAFVPHHVNLIVWARLPKRPQAHLGQSRLKDQPKITFITIYGDARPSTRLSSWKDQLGDHNLPAEALDLIGMRPFVTQPHALTTQR